MTTVLISCPPDTSISIDGTAATKNSNNAATTNILSQTTRGATKAYCEAQFTTLFSIGVTYIGIGLSTTSLTIPLGFYADAYGWIHTGRVQHNSSFVRSDFPSYSAGDWLAFAVDRTAQTFQVRNITTNSAWTTTTSIADLGSADICAAVGFYYVGDVVTYNFDGTFLGTPPDGTYTRWDGSSTTPPPPTGTLSVTEGPDSGAGTGTVTKTFFFPPKTSSLITLSNTNLTATKVADLAGTLVATDAPDIAAMTDASAPTTTWDPSHISETLILSGGNLTASQAGSSVNSHTRSTVAHSSGKFYAELTVTTRVGAGDTYSFGVLNSTESFTNYLGETANSYAWYDDGAVLFNGGQPHTIQTFSQGDIICMAVDVSAALIWFRTNGGNWNNNSSNNPATGVGGFGISGVTGQLYVGNEMEVFTDAGTVNFGASAYAYLKPSGFSNW